ncbi:MAG: hypothetical protein U0807_09245 [Candidatus Binatia bacterium]
MTRKSVWIVGAVAAVVAVILGYWVGDAEAVSRLPFRPPIRPWPRPRPTPEIDPGAMRAGLTLLLGGVAVLADRFRRR